MMLLSGQTCAIYVRLCQALERFSYLHCKFFGFWLSYRNSSRYVKVIAISKDEMTTENQME